MRLISSQFGAVVVVVVVVVVVALMVVVEGDIQEHVASVNSGEEGPLTQSFKFVNYRSSIFFSVIKGKP